MFSFRRLARRVIKPVVMVGVVGSLASMMIITTPSTAHALKVRDVKAAETFIMGATKTMAPAANVALAAGSFTPVGMGIRLFQLGMIAYSTSDIWMPIVAGAFGEATAEDENVEAPGGTRVYSGFTFNSITQVNTNVWQLNGLAPEVSGSSVFTGYAAKLSCKNRTTGVITQRTVTVKSSISAGAAGRAWQFSLYCGNTQQLGTATNEDLVGGVFGAHGADPALPVSCFSGGNSTPACYWPGPSNVFQWGDQLTGGDPAFDPYGADVKYKVKSECIDASGVKTIIESETSGDYVRFPSCEAAGKGHGTGQNTITGLAPGKTVEQPLWDSPAAPSDPATPLCDAGRPTGGCVLSIEKDGQPCATGDPECENWAEINKNDPNQTRLKCKLGPYTLPMSACGLLEKAYFPGGAPATEENTDGNPDTSNWKDPQGTPLAPRVPGPVTTTTVPGTGGQVDPNSEQSTRNCFPTGFAAFNPVEWVLQPIRCAFTPKASTYTQFTTRLQTRIATVGFAPMATAWLAAYQDVGGGSGCSGPTVNFQMNGVGQTLQPFQACTEPMATVAAIANGVSTVAIVLFGGLAMVRAIGAAFGLNFSMGGKSDGE